MNKEEGRRGESLFVWGPIRKVETKLDPICLVWEG